MLEKDYREIFELAAEVSETDPKTGIPKLKPANGYARYVHLQEHYIKKGYEPSQVDSMYVSALNEITQIRKNLEQLSPQDFCCYERLFEELFLFELELSETSLSTTVESSSSSDSVHKMESLLDKYVTKKVYDINTFRKVRLTARKAVLNYLIDLDEQEADDFKLKDINE